MYISTKFWPIYTAKGKIHAQTVPIGNIFVSLMTMCVFVVIFCAVRINTYANINDAYFIGKRLVWDNETPKYELFVSNEKLDSTKKYSIDKLKTVKVTQDDFNKAYKFNAKITVDKNLTDWGDYNFYKCDVLVALTIICFCMFFLFLLIRISLA